MKNSVNGGGASPPVNELRFWPAFRGYAKARPWEVARAALWLALALGIALAAAYLSARHRAGLEAEIERLQQACNR